MGGEGERSGLMNQSDRVAQIVRTTITTGHNSDEIYTISTVKGRAGVDWGERWVIKKFLANIRI